MRAITLTGFALLSLVAGSSAASTPAASAKSQAVAITLAPQINGDDFNRFDKTLSSDAFGGRKPGTPGAKLTTDWLVQQFQQMGLQPGNHGSWYQTVPADSTLLLNPQVTLDIATHGKSLKLAYRTDMVAQTLQGKATVDLKQSPLIFVGYGADAPAWHWNDYRDLDVKGKTVIVLVNDPGFASRDPKFFNGRAMTWYGRWPYKYAEAALQGAAACFIVHTSDAAAGYPWSVLQNGAVGPQLSLPGSVDPAPRLPVAGWLTRDAAQRLFAAAGKNFDQLEQAASKPGFKPVALDATASMTLHNKIGHFESKNVVAMVEGSAKPDEAVIYTAHWDHLGTDPSHKGHKVYSGAIDNGTGLSMLLEIANAFAHAPQPPDRSVLFFLPTLEESGLLGSQYYAVRPIFPMNRTVADIAVDALPIIGPAHDMTVIGKGQSELEDLLAGVLKKQGRVISPETTPENGFYFRSDHFNFARAGVPAMLASSGLDLIDGGKAAGQKGAEDYTAHHYHTTNDVFDPNWDLRGILEDTQALYELGEHLGHAGVWPAWYADSPFRAKREAMMKPTKAADTAH
jgi:Zn-dependent M28 family amino/carboxypeptidase